MVTLAQATVRRTIDPADVSQPYLYVYSGPGLTVWFIDRATQGGEIALELPDGSRVTFRLQGTPTGLTPTVSGDTLSFVGGGNVTLQVQEQADGRLKLKYTTTLTAKPSGNVVGWTVTTTPGATKNGAGRVPQVVAGADGTLSLRDADGTEWYTQPPPTATDKNGAAVAVTATLSGGVLTYTLANLATNRYPVTVDPTTVATSASNPSITGWSNSGHLFYATNLAQWVMVWAEEGSNAINFRYSTDLTTWTTPTGSPFTPASARQLATDNRSFTTFYKAIGTTDVVWATYGSFKSANPSSGHQLDDIRFTLGASSVTKTNDTAGRDSTSDTTAAQRPGTGAVALSSGNFVHLLPVFENLSLGNFNGRSNPNADAGTSFTEGTWNTVVNVATVTNWVNRTALIPLASNVMLGLAENAAATEATSMTNVLYQITSGTNGLTWPAGTGTGVRSATITGRDPGDWGVCKITNTDIHLILVTGTNTFEHFTHNGTQSTGAWTTATAPANQTIKAGSGPFLATDGTDLWLFIIDSDAANTVRANKYTVGSASWSGWAAVVSTTAVRNYLSGAPLAQSGTIGLCWTEGSSSPFSLVVTGYSTASGSTTPFSLSGTQAQSGSLVHQRGQPLAGTQPQVGTSVRRVDTVRAGTQAQAGSLLHQAGRSAAGTQAQSGTVTVARVHPVALSGTQAQSGAVGRTVAHPLAGTQPQVGSLVHQVGPLRAGTQAQSGTSARQVGRAAAGTQAQVGTLARATLHPVALSGTQTQAGTSVRQGAVVRSGTQAQAGTLAVARTTVRALSGTQPQAGTSTRQVVRPRAGTQAQAGTLSAPRRVVQASSGTQAQLGTLSHRGAPTLAGTQPQAGTMSRAGTLSRAGTQAQVGTLARVLTAARTAVGTQPQSGTLTHRVGLGLQGVQAELGSLARRVAHPSSGTQAQTGAVTASFAFTRTGTGTQAQSGSLTFTHPTPISRAGTQAQAGTATRGVARGLVGTQPQTGAATHAVAQPLSGTQAQSGAVHPTAGRLLSGAQPQAGALQHRSGWVVTGTQPQAGALRATVAHTLSGTQPQVGTGQATFQRGAATYPVALSGTQPQTGTAARQGHYTVTGAQPQAGGLTEGRPLALVGTQPQRGALQAVVSAGLGGTQGQAGTAFLGLPHVLLGRQVQLGSLTAIWQPPASIVVTIAVSDRADGTVRLQDRAAGQVRLQDTAYGTVAVEDRPG